jgi:RNA polymerase sigma factor (sigma-70 family)
MEHTTVYHESRIAFHLFVRQAYADLNRFRKEDNREAFNTLLLKVMPEVKRYVAKRLYTALAKGDVSKGKYKPEDFTDQLFIEVYDHFDDIADEKELHPWLFKKADELLEDVLVEEEFDMLFFENIDTYAKPEWDAMEERFSSDGDGDLVMLEELDDISYRKHDYIVKNVFLEDGRQDQMAKLDEQLGKDAIEKHAEMVLHHLPIPMRSVFELFTEHQFTLPEIAKIRNRTVQEVEQLLENARDLLETSFYNRYLNH